MAEVSGVELCLILKMTASNQAFAYEETIT